MSSGKLVVFNDPRRFGVMDLIPAADLQSYPALSRLGPEPLSDDFDAAALARACRGKKTSLKAALLDQRVVAGLGNIYASEALHVAGLSPAARRRRSPPGLEHRVTPPVGLAAAIKQVLEQATARLSPRSVYRDSPFLVYDRQDEPCVKQRLRRHDPAPCAGGTVNLPLPAVSAVAGQSPARVSD